MAHKEPPFSEADLAAIAKCIDSAATHTELDSLLRDVGLLGPAGRSRIFQMAAHLQCSRERTKQHCDRESRDEADPNCFVSKTFCA
jgi:hypothetical protein